MTSNTPAFTSAKEPCDRCEGQGYIQEFKHVEKGICFKCRGAKSIAVWRVARKPKVVVKQKTNHQCSAFYDEPITQWGCSVCGLDEWCGSDGCPLDPQ